VDHDRLRQRMVAAVNRHWRTSIDRGGAAPALLDELVIIADEHAAEMNKAATEGTVSGEAAPVLPPAAGGSGAADPVVITSVGDPPGTTGSGGAGGRPAGSPSPARAGGRTRGGAGK
jgi:hypothetical protein